MPSVYVNARSRVRDRSDESLLADGDRVGADLASVRLAGFVTERAAVAGERRTSMRRTLVNLMHVRAFTEAVQRKDLEAMLANMTEDIVLETPLFKEPFQGKEALRTVVGALLGIVDSFDFQELMEGPRHVSAFYVVRTGAEILDGVDYWRLDEAGLITRMKVLWRPLPALAALQRRLDAAA